MAYILSDTYIYSHIFQDLDDMNIEIMRNTLYKAYLEDFYRFCQVIRVSCIRPTVGVSTF